MYFNMENSGLKTKTLFRVLCSLSCQIICRSIYNNSFKNPSITPSFMLLQKEFISRPRYKFNFSHYKTVFSHIWNSHLLGTQVTKWELLINEGSKTKQNQKNPKGTILQIQTFLSRTFFSVFHVNFKDLEKTL